MDLIQYCKGVIEKGIATCGCGKKANHVIAVKDYSGEGLLWRFKCEAHFQKYMSNFKKRIGVVVSI
jgi:hypothetical protein